LKSGLSRGLMPRLLARWAALLCIMDMCPHLAEIAHVERGSTDPGNSRNDRQPVLRARWPKCRCCQEGSFILQIEHIPLAVDYLSVG